MPNYTAIIDYVLYDRNDAHGRVPFLDNSDERDDLVERIMAACSLTDS